MRAIIINKRLALLKACIFSGLAVICLTANAEDTPEYAAVPSMDDCHYDEHPIIRETVHSKNRHVTRHHIRAHHNSRSTNDLSVYFPFSAPSYLDNMWPSNGCHCEDNGYAVSRLSSDELTYDLMNYGPLYEAGNEAAPCDESSAEE